MELELSSSFLLLSFPPYFLLLCYPILYTFVSSFGPSTSIHVTLSSSLPTFVSAHPFQKFYPTKKEAFFLRTFLSLVLKNFLIQKRREREFYGYNLFRLPIGRNYYGFLFRDIEEQCIDSPELAQRRSHFDVLTSILLINSPSLKRSIERLGLTR